jgi:hypothetical protein
LKTRAISGLFAVAAIYDGVLGLVFLFAGQTVFDLFKVTPPNHPGYIQFPAAVLIIFAMMFSAVAKAPLKNGNLIIYGMLLKVAYSSVVLRYWLTTDLPDMWKPFCVADILFLFLFAWSWRTLRTLQVNREREAEVIPLTRT